MKVVADTDYTNYSFYLVTQALKIIYAIKLTSKIQEVKLHQWTAQDIAMLDRFLVYTLMNNNTCKDIMLQS